MATTRQNARIAFGKALTVLGCVTLMCTLTGMAALALMERAAMQPSGNPEGQVVASDIASKTAADDKLDNVDWDYWLAVNPDIVAWIRVPGTGIDLPVVAPPDEDPQRYLSHDVHGNWNPCGCPYVDASCGDGINSRNVVVYGHNMGDDSMFGSLVKYLDPAWAQEHRTVQLVTPECTRNLEIAGCRTIDGGQGEKLTSFDNDDQFKQYVRETASSCPLWTVSANARQDRLYTICTCSYISNPADERTLVYAFETDEGMARS